MTQQTPKAKNYVLVKKSYETGMDGGVLCGRYFSDAPAGLSGHSVCLRPGRSAKYRPRVLRKLLCRQ